MAVTYPSPFRTNHDVLTVLEELAVKWQTNKIPYSVKSRISVGCLFSQHCLFYKSRVSAEESRKDGVDLGATGRACPSRFMISASPQRVLPSGFPPGRLQAPVVMEKPCKYTVLVMCWPARRTTAFAETHHFPVVHFIIQDYFGYVKFESSSMDSSMSRSNIHYSLCNNKKERLWMEPPGYYHGRL